MNVQESKIYQQLLDTMLKNSPISHLRDKNILITGATGMICSCLIDLLLRYNKKEDANCKIIAVVRNLEYAEKRFANAPDSDCLTFLQADITQPFSLRKNEKIDYIIHAASTTHPVAYSKEPINTILSNIRGLENMLEIAYSNQNTRLLFVSSVEIYGENRGDLHGFVEDDMGYINCNTLRAGYPEAKRLCEALCQAYIREKGIDTTVIRLPRVYGPTTRIDDSKASAQFLRNALNHEDIVLKSDGMQFFSYAHVADAVTGMLYVLAHGQCGAAYNLADENSDISLKDLAQCISDCVSRKVVFDLPNMQEKIGFSPVTKSVLNADKLKKTGWTPCFNIQTGIRNTMEILTELRG